MAETCLMNCIVGLLAPLLMTAGVTDPAVARLAAAEAVAACEGDLMSAGQSVGFGLIALDNLRLSIPAELSLSMKLKLRGNANALSRSGRDVRQAQRVAKPVPPEPCPEEEALAPPPPPAETERLNRLQWADAMRRAARELKSDGGAEEPANLLWIEALSGVANDLTKGGKADLMRSTMLAGMPAPGAAKRPKR